MIPAAIFCPTCEATCPADGGPCPRCGHRFLEAAIPRSTRREIAAIRIIATLALVVAGGAALLGTLQVLATGDWLGLAIAIQALLLGLLLTAIAGIWSALEQIAAFYSIGKPARPYDEPNAAVGKSDSSVDLNRLAGVIEKLVEKRDSRNA